MDKIQIIEKLFFNILAYSYLLLPGAFIIDILYRRKSEKKGVSLFVIYGLVFFFLNAFIYYIKNLRELIYYPGYTVLEYSFFSYLLWSNIPEKKFYRLKLGSLSFEVSKKNLLFSCFSFLFFAFLAFFYLNQEIRSLDSIPIGLETILIFIFIIYFFYGYFNSARHQFIYNHYCFWISVGLLIYLGGTFFLNLLANSMDKTEIHKFWFLTYAIEILKNVLFTIALFMYMRQPKENSVPKSIPYLDMTLEKTN